MNEEELLKILNKEKSYTEEDLLIFIYELRKENTELKDNWNKLKEWLEENWKESQDIWFVKIINKMQEIEGRMNECI